MKNSVISAAILIALSITASPAYAQTVKKWVDEEGVTHFSDQKPVDVEGQVNEIEVPKANVSEFGSEETNKRIQTQLKQMEEDRKAREQEAEAKEKARALEESIEREPLFVEEEKKKKDKRGSNYRGPYPKPPPGPFPKPRPGINPQN